jgi:YD repeat-containing protein
VDGVQLRTGLRVSQVTDNIGRTVTYTYDASGRLSTVTDPEVTTYTWNGSILIVGDTNH